MFHKKPKIRIAGPYGTQVKRQKRKRKPKKPLSNGMVNAIRATFSISILLLILICVTYFFTREESSVQASTEYEEQNGMPVIHVGSKVKSYYEDKKEWNVKKGFSGASGTHTSVNTVVLDENKKEKQVSWFLDVTVDGNNRRVLIKNDDSFESFYTSDIRLIGKDLYALVHGETKKGEYQNGYVYTSRDETAFDLSSFTQAYDFVSLIVNEDADSYEIIHNCRTEKDGTEYDDLTIYFEEYGSFFRVFVKPDTGLIEYIISPMLSSDDITKVVYGKMSVSGFSDEDVDNPEPVDKKHKITTLPDKTKGCVVDNREMVVILSNAANASSYGSLPFSSYDREKLGLTGSGNTSESEEK